VQGVGFGNYGLKRLKWLTSALHSARQRLVWGVGFEEADVADQRQRFALCEAEVGKLRSSSAYSFSGHGSTAAGHIAAKRACDVAWSGVLL
jgi:hypothetical protein